MARLGFVFVLTTCATLFAQQDLPTHDDEESFDIEPPLLIKDGKPLPPLPSETASPAPGDPTQIQTMLERARRSAAAGERLVKAGVLAKVQAEERALKVVRLENDLAQAQLDAAKQQQNDVQQQFERGEVSRAAVDVAAAAVADAEATAKTAGQKRDQAEIEAARINLQRQQKLLVLGSAHKSDVSRAEQKLAELLQK